jgi:SnoaL-like domain
MTTEQISARLVELCRQGQYETAQRELYHADATSTEPADAPNAGTVKGLDAIVQKGKHFMAMVQEVHAAHTGDPIVSGNHFVLRGAMDMTFKDGSRRPMDELCIYKVDGGKIVSEQFIY